MGPSGRLVKQQKYFSLGQAQVGIGGLPACSQGSEAGARPWVCVPHSSIHLTRLPTPLSLESGFCPEPCAHKTSELPFPIVPSFSFFLSDHCHK